MATAKQLDDITECSICTEVYTDPRVLPCVHTFCLKCIEAWSKGKQPGDKLACPVCRKEFTLPRNGVEDLPKNFFFANFLQMKELTSVESKTSGCEACRGGEATELKVATVYCVECQQKLCQDCEEDHQKFKVTRRHKTVELGSEALSQTVPLSTCEKHVDKYLEIYCFDCKLAICMMCYINAHNKHKCSDVNEIAPDLRKRMAIDVDRITAGVDKCREVIAKIEKEKNDFLEKVTKTGMEIGEKAEQLKRMIDVHKERLINELSSLKRRRMREIESLREEIEGQLLSMESYKKYADEVREKGTACDIARAASDLHDRADELLKFDVIERALDDLAHADVTFTSSDFVVDDADKTLGKLRFSSGKTAGKSIAPTLTHVKPSPDRGGVSAVMSLGDEVFVVRWGGQQVEVYDAGTFTLQRHITPPGQLRGACGLAVCARHRCLYVSDWHNSNIHVADLSGSNAVKKWSVASGPRGLSVNNAHNVVVACCGANKLQEYTTQGILVKEISLQQAGVTDPWHAVQLSTGDYVVSQYTSPGVVSVVGVDGQVVRRYDQSQSSDVRQMRYPASLAVTKNDDILVADSNNNRILSIDCLLSSAQVLALPVHGGIQGPCGLCLDESRGRLYVGEGDGKPPVLVFDVTF